MSQTKLPPNQPDLGPITRFRHHEELTRSEIDARVELLSTIDEGTARRFVAESNFEWLPLYVAIHQTFDATPKQASNVMNEFIFEGYARLQDGTLYHAFRNKTTKRLVRLIVDESFRQIIGVDAMADGRLERGSRTQANASLSLSFATYRKEQLELRDVMA